MIEQNKTYLKNRGFIFFVLFFLFTNLYSDSTNSNEYEALQKSINIKLSYSFFANSKAIVLLPTRLAPSNKQADRSAYFSFHSNNSLYTFRLNIYPPVMKLHYFNITLAEKRYYFNILFRLKRHYFNVLLHIKRRYFNILTINIVMMFEV